MRKEKFDVSDVAEKAKCMNLIFNILEYDAEKGKNYDSEIQISQHNNEVEVSFICGYEQTGAYECEFIENGTLQ